MNSIPPERIFDIKMKITDAWPVQTRLNLMQNNMKELQTESAGIVEHEKMFAERRKQLQQGCDKYRNQASYGGVQEAIIRVTQMRWINRENLIVCLLAKVGSSSWCHYLLSHHYNGTYPSQIRKNSHALARDVLVPQPGLTGEEMLQQLTSFTKVLTVRHPFARLVSAFQSKVVAWAESEEMLQQLTSFTKILTVRHPFARLVSAFQSKVVAWAERKRNKLPLPPKPLFKDFAEYLIETAKVPIMAVPEAYDSFNNHWRPFFLVCGVCDLSYEYIVKMETWSDDLRYLLPKFHIEFEDQSYGDILNSTAIYFEYFKTLPESLILQLYEIYKIDFELFGYSMDGYL
ncbi:carbohydrate sulfotransferase 12-like [Hyalella azteca]|uniref:Carbohydrate sulfotransferase n=1 Tax=Hyalella azteca TaxID=294128 RepID=A0A8B7N7I2_HYAAZ|nr:carbohydrate sulfotransferase 12-like [Hyalella azteca]